MAEQQPFILYDTMTLPVEISRRGISFPQQRIEVNFAGVPDPHAPDLVVPERHLVRLALATDVRQFVAEQLGFDGGSPLWFAVDTPRYRVLPSDLGGRPGDFDIVVGRIEDGVPAVDDLGVVEVKRLVVNADGTDARSSSGNGTEQAAAALRTGFDRAMLLHLVVSRDREPPEGWSVSLAALANADHRVALDRAAGRLRSAAEMCGAAIVGWARAPGTNPTRSGAIVPVPLRRAAFRPLRDQAGVADRRQELANGFASLLAAVPPAPFYAWCTACAALCATRDPSLTCMRCGRRAA